MPDRMMRTWARSTDIGLSLASAGRSILNLLSDYETEKGTLRTRGTISAFYGDIILKPQGSLALGALQRGAVAIGVLTEGTTSTTMPDPTSESFHWLWKWEFMLFPEQFALSGGGTDFVPIYRHVEVRSQRTMRFNETLFAVFVNLAGAALSIGFTGNILLKQ